MESTKNKLSRKKILENRFQISQSCTQYPLLAKLG